MIGILRLFDPVFSLRKSVPFPLSLSLSLPLSLSLSLSPLSLSLSVCLFPARSLSPPTLFLSLSSPAGDMVLTRSKKYAPCSDSVGGNERD